MDFHPSEEQLLIAGCKKNESWARKKLYELYAPAMLGVCVRYTSNYETAKDLLHEGFIKIFTKINSFSGEGALGAWVRRVFVTTALEFLRDDRSLQHTDIIHYEEKIEDVAISVVEQLSAEEILKCISELPQGYRLVFNMHAIEGYSHVEIAKMLKIKEASSRSQFSHARQLLQNKIQKLHIHKNTKKKYE
jgi:RNA polymerase sigma-70 factor (ECF subfamily)